MFFAFRLLSFAVALYTRAGMELDIPMSTPPIAPDPREDAQLDSVQLARLEQAFRDWASGPERPDVVLSRKRILLIFLLIRYTGAKLNEVLSLRPATDIDAKGKTIAFGGHAGEGSELRQVHVSDALLADFFTLSRDLEVNEAGCMFAIDPAFVRRKFYERANACGFSRKQGGPEMLRKARTLELMQDSLPLPAIQQVLGLSTLDLSSVQAFFSESELEQTVKWFVEREAQRMTSARNSFFGKIAALKKGSVQALLEVSATDGKTVTAVVTNDSVKKMGLKVGGMVTAEIKAPWLVIERPGRSGRSSLENEREGEITKITRGGVNTECVVRIGQGMELCAVVSTPGFDALSLCVGDQAKILFSCSSVILHT